MSSKKPEPRHYKMNLSGILSTLGSLSTNTKRGHISIGYFIWAYALSMAIIFAIITVINLDAIVKVLLIIVTAVLLFRLVFFNSRIRNYLIGTINKIQDFKEKK